MNPLGMSPSLEFMPHTADVRLKASGETLPQLFKTCLEGMNKLLKPGFCHDNRVLDVYDKIDISAMDSTVLLIDFLSEVLTLSNVNKAVYCECDIEKMSDHELKGLLKGKNVEGFDNDIKAVTYHEADVQLNEHGDFETIIVFDI